MLADQADVSAAYQMKDEDARGWFVYNTLKQHAARTQAGVRAELEARGVGYQSFWVANMIVADADRALIDTLALRSDVARIDSNDPVRWIEEPEIANAGVTPAAPNAPNAIEWGVANVNAPSVWGAGFIGTGIVIGNLDTGIRWTHNALKPKYRGWNGLAADHNFNWHDAIHSGGGSCGFNTAAPCDDNGHGTHTAGTMVGDDGTANQIGVAPGAKWIGCRNMDQGVGTPATYTECLQFMIAPTDLSGNNPNPELRPHVLSNSWACTTTQGCTTRSELETIIDNTQAAGIFVDVSAGNGGPTCSTVASPPAIYTASFTVGTYDINNTLAGFSGRGPSTYYAKDVLKPNLVAPGVNVRSSLNGGDSSYGNLSGTSMSVPHVAGVVALLWSARPHLVRDIAATKAVLEKTANPAVTLNLVQTCGTTSSSQVPNNSFGYGRVDALAAVNAAVPPTPTPTPTATATATPSATETPTPTSTPTPTATPEETVTPTPTPVQDSSLGNISTRLRVETGDNVLIGGFIVTGTQNKKVIIRAIGPSLPVAGALQDTVLELHDSSGALIDFNDNWVDAPNKQEIIDSTIPPANDFESAIVTTLPANNVAYTAIVRGVNETIGVGLIEIYDLDQTVDSKLANISTRGLVQTGDNVMIGGFIVLGQNAQRVIVRAIGPSLPVAAVLADPKLEIYDVNGTLLAQNDNWRSDQEAEIIATTVPPSNDLESAIVGPASPGNYTAVVGGVNDTTGVALVEVYALHE
jgi:subtilisin family serine protease